MAAAPSSCPVPTMTKDQKEIESNKRGTRLPKDFAKSGARRVKVMYGFHYRTSLFYDGLVSIAGVSCCQYQSVATHRARPLYLGLAFAISTFEGRRFNRKASL